MTRAFASANTYPVSVTITNPSTQQTFTTSAVNVAVGTQQGSGNNCKTMDGTNVFVAHHNSANNCGGFGQPQCGPNQTLTFEAMGYNYDFACGNHTYNWDFEGTLKSGKVVQHSFSTGGPHTVKLTINNGQTFSFDTIVNLGGGGGPVAPAR
jgi:hypothetical protein